MVMKHKGAEQGFEDTYRYEWPITALAASAGVPPTPVTRTPYRGYSYTIADASILSAPVPNDWEDLPSTAITFYVRWLCNEAYALANGEVRFQSLYYTTDQNNQLLGAGTTATVNSGDVNIPTTALMIQESACGTILAANLAAGDTIGVTLSRVALGAGVNPTAEPEIIAVWMEYTRFIAV
jgi:hypothetical protein